MIQRIRRPDGSSADVDLGPGPVGTYSDSGYQRAMNALPLTMALAPKVDGWSSAWDLERNLRNKARKRG